MKQGALRLGLGGVLGLGLIHLALGLLPGPTLAPSVNFALFATNLYVLFCARPLFEEASPRPLVLFVGGYVGLLVLLLAVLGRESLFILLIIVYASVYRSRFLLGFFGIFVLSFVLLQPYAFESFVPLCFVYLVLWRVKGSGFLRACLGLGLLALSALLFPLIHLMIQDSAQTLLLTVRRPDVLEAIGLSLASSTVATILVTLWGVPLAYALARSDFAGKRVIESLIDLPILVPHSVAGIALMVLLGPGSPLGSALEARFGLQVAGRFVGIVVAQAFVAAPFLIKSALTAFEAVPSTLELASRTLGASPAMTFRRIALRLASRGIFVGMILAWARAISEFGSIVLFASSPVTAPILVHTEFLRAGGSESRPIAVVLLMTCLWVFILLQFGQTFLPFSRRQGRAERPS